MILVAVVALTLNPGQIPDIVADAELAKLCTVERHPSKSDCQRLVIHIADYHFVDRKPFAAGLRDQDATITKEQIATAYNEHVARVRRVQAQQTAVIQRLVDRHGVKDVHKGSLTDADGITIAFIIASLRRTRKRDSPMWLRIGAPGQMVVNRKLEVVRPVEDTRAFLGAGTSYNDRLLVRIRW